MALLERDKMKTIIVSVTTGYVGAKVKCEIEVADDATDDEIEELALMAMHGMIEWSWWEKTKDNQ